MTAFTLADLEAIVASRNASGADTSYTGNLLAGGPPLAAKKLGEEAIEVVIASLRGERKQLTSEAADLLYHLLVVLRLGGVGLHEVLAELEKRTLQSGLAEKARRAAR